MGKVKKQIKYVFEQGNWNIRIKMFLKDSGRMEKRMDMGSIQDMMEEEYMGNGLMMNYNIFD